MTVASAVVIADSVTAQESRLTSIQETFWRPVLAERNTHTIQKKNSASSRAIPFETMLKRFEENPADPLVWAAEQKGMQGGAELTGKDLKDAQDLWQDIKGAVAYLLHEYLLAHPDKATRLHKSLLNRTLEFGQWHVATITATAWENYFYQRCSEQAQPEIRAVAEAGRIAYDSSEPLLMLEREWHVPYIHDEDRAEMQERGRAAGTALDLEVRDRWFWRQLTRISSARVGRTSYLTQDGKRDLKEDVNLYEKLINPEKGGPIHWSPLEQIATPDFGNWLREPYRFIGIDGEQHVVDTSHLPRVGPFPGWRTMRTEVEAQRGIVTYR